MDIWAPGTSIYSSIASDKRDKYEYKQGTSMASPYIAGVVANLLYIHPNMSYDEVRQVLVMNAKPVRGGVCSSQFKCPRVQYVCESPLVFDLPHTLTILEIIFIALGCCLVCCILTCIGLWIVKIKRDKSGDEKREYGRTNDEATDEEIDEIDDEAETQCIVVKDEEEENETEGHDFTN